MLPMLDGISHEQARAVSGGVQKAIDLDEADAAILERRLLAMAL